MQMISRRHYCVYMGEREMPEYIIGLKFILVYACANFYKQNVKEAGKKVVILGESWIPGTPGNWFSSLAVITGY